MASHMGAETTCDATPLTHGSWEQRKGWRHVIAALVFIIVLICYADRTNIGIVMAQHNFPGVSPSQKGTVFSAFFIGYFCTQIPGGLIARRWGSKPTLLLAALVWTTFDVLTTLAGNAGFWPLVLDRIGMGLGEGLMFPTQHALTTFWVPPQERAFLVAFMTSGQDLGSVVANLVSPQLLNVGPALVFVAWGSVAVVWTLVYSRLGASAPEVHARCLNSGEAAWIQQERSIQHFDSARQVRVPAFPRHVLREPSAWAVYIAHFGFNYTWYVVLSWLPSFFLARFDLKLAQSPVVLASPYFAAWIGNLFWGRLSDFLVKRGARPRHVRKSMQLGGAITLSIFAQLVAGSGSAGWAALWMSLALFFGKAQMSGFWVNMVDLCPETAATMMAISNTLATIPGIAGQPITQAILDSQGGAAVTGAWQVVFGVAGVVAVTCAAFFVLLGNDVQLDGAGQAARGSAGGDEERGSAGEARS